MWGKDIEPCTLQERKTVLCHDVISFKSCLNFSSSNCCANGLLCCSFNKTHTLNLKRSPITGSECLLASWCCCLVRIWKSRSWDLAGRSKSFWVDSSFDGLEPLLPASLSAFWSASMWRATAICSCCHWLSFLASVPSHNGLKYPPTVSQSNPFLSGAASGGYFIIVMQKVTNMEIGTRSGVCTVSVSKSDYCCSLSFRTYLLEKPEKNLKNVS